MAQIKGTKLNMSQIFLENGTVVPVTLIKTDVEISDELNSKEVVVKGVSKGKGFTGVMKKWHFHGQQATRGQSTKPRAPGAIGSQTPGKVLKGKKMAGRKGNYNVTIKGLKVVNVNSASKIFMVSGPIPGARNSAVTVEVL